ncbi:hypothetical protein ACFTSF_25510 [Kribbella sp. NPDC056951]|uniref:hypothetical protein n=1 Tax=Kribbella sp. NPDC056951 TaxID=3345978 RepID=UPI00362CDA8C
MPSARDRGRGHWTGYRAGRLDPTRYGVAAGSPLSGLGCIRLYVVMEVLHRYGYGYETLLWDGVADGITDADADQISHLLLAADAGDTTAEDHLEHQVDTDPDLRLGPTLTQFSPYGDPPITIDLRSRRV